MRLRVQEVHVGKVEENLAHVSKANRLDGLQLPVGQARLELYRVGFEDTEGNRDDHVLGVDGDAALAYDFVVVLVPGNLLDFLVEVDVEASLAGKSFYESLITTEYNRLSPFIILIIHGI